jgi:hypothetical protein
MRPCLPRCFNPVFSTPCQDGQVVCCIEWTMPCGTLRYDGAFVLKCPYKPFYDDPLCMSTLSGNTGIMDILGVTASGFPYTECGDPHECGPSGFLQTQLYGNDTCEVFDKTIFLGPAGEDISGTWLICGIDDVVGGEEEGCHEWPTFLEELSGHTEGPETSVVFEPDNGIHADRWIITTHYYSARPRLRWYCTGNDRIMWEAGWDLIRQSFYDVVYSEPSDPPPEATGNEYWSWCGFFPISTGETGTDWYSLGAPFELENSVGTGGDTFNSTITPVVCNYEPCGEPLDCFVSCISGSKDCDGVTPAHKPYIYFTLINPGCCLAGTYAMSFAAGAYTATATCVDVFGISHTMEITLNCAATDGGESSDTPGLAFLHLDFYATYPDTSTDYEHYDISVPLSCSDGELVEASGYLSETYCGLFSDADWVISS